MSMNKAVTALIVLVMLIMPVMAAASPCGTTSLDNILALPNATCTIAGTTFAFNVPLNGVPEYYSGPWAGIPSTWGPASNITFTPDVSDPTNPGFTLSGNFHSGAYTAYEITLGFFTIGAPAGWNVDGYSVDMVNPVYTTTDPNDAALFVSLNSVYALNGSPSASGPSYMVGNTIYGNIDLRFWNPRGGGDVGFDAASFHFHESLPSTTAPEPASMLLLGVGLAALASRLRRRSV
jgi:hypothetical protein